MGWWKGRGGRAVGRPGWGPSTHAPTHRSLRFFPAVAYLATSRVPAAVLANAGLAAVLTAYQVLTSVFLGTLREAEVERVHERLGQAGQRGGGVVVAGGGVVRGASAGPGLPRHAPPPRRPPPHLSTRHPPGTHPHPSHPPSTPPPPSKAVMETCLAMTVFRDDATPEAAAAFVCLALAKVLHWLAADRVAHLESAPGAGGRGGTVRVAALLALLLAADGALLQHALARTLAHAAGVHVLFAFECVRWRGSSVGSGVGGAGEPAGGGGGGVGRAGPGPPQKPHGPHHPPPPPPPPPARAGRGPALKPLGTLHTCMPPHLALHQVRHPGVRRRVHSHQAGVRHRGARAARWLAGARGRDFLP